MSDWIIYLLFGIILFILGIVMNMKGQHPLNTIGFWIAVIGMILIVVPLIFLSQEINLTN